MASRLFTRGDRDRSAARRMAACARRPLLWGAPAAVTAAATESSRYGQSALRGEAARVAAAREGTRNTTLFQAAAAIGSLCAGGELVEADARAALAQAASKCGLPDEEAARTIGNGFVAGGTSPRRAPTTLLVQPGGLHKLVDASMAALMERQVELYQRDCKLIDVRRDPSAAEHGAGECNVVTLRVLDAHALRLTLARNIKFKRMKSNAAGGADPVPCDPPMPLVHALLAAGDWPVPALVGVTVVPTLRPDGTVLDAPGYDERTRLLFEPGRTAFPKVPEVPTYAEACDALAKLNDVLCDFPFRASVDRAVALAAMVTVVVRAGLRGNCPMFLFDAHTPGSGKTMLADVAAVIGTGRSAPRVAQTRDEETEKRITAHMLAGDPLVLFDNVSQALGGSALDAALTGEIWGGRVLGKSERVQLPNKVTFVATGNNMQIKGDLARRALRCCLDPAEERPEERGGFRHPNLLKWVRAQRPELVVAALTLVRAYVVAGKPDMALPAFGSFEAWAELVRAPLVWAGVADPVASQRELSAEADSGRGAWGQALRGLRALFGSKRFHGADVLAKTEPQEHFALDVHPVRAALQGLNPGRDLDNRAVGRLFAHWKGRNVGGLRLDRIDRDAAGVIWRVNEIGADAAVLAPRRRDTS
jgi:putative DNA primase/helicase